MKVSSPDLPKFVRDLLASPPKRGEGLNLWLFRVARVLHPYRTPAEIIETLAATTFGEPVKAGEIERAVQNSAVYAWKPGQRLKATPAATTWPAVNQERRAAIMVTGRGMADLWETSPERLEDGRNRAEEVVDTLFPGSPLLCVGLSNSKFATMERDQFRGRLAELQLIVPSPMSAIKGLTKEGRESEHSLANTGPRRFLVIEFDLGTADEHAAILLHLAEHAPLALAVHSGSRSMHGWFYCAGQPEESLRRFMAYAVSLGADKATWTPSQFVRMPDGRRENGKRQTVFFFNPEVVQ